MSGDGTVWDHGPQYPDLWPEPAGEPAVGLGDPTPPSPSPVDLDAREAAERPAPQPRPAPKRPPAWWRRRILGLAVWAWLVAGAAIVVVAVIATTSGGDDPQLVIDTTTPSTVSVAPPATIAPSLAPTLPQTVPATVPPTIPEPTIPPATSPPVTPPQVSVAPPSVPDTTVAPPPTTAAPPTVAPDGPVVLIGGRVAPCDFGSNCLVAGFIIQGFDHQPSVFVCEFADGSRYSFEFSRQGVARACATGNTNGSITIEVEGVRSETFTRP